MNRRLFIGSAVASLLSAAQVGPARAATGADRFRAAEWGLGRRFLTGTFGRMAFVDAGSGAPALFLHGFPLNGFQWRHAVGQLAPLYRCVVPDLLGLGASEAAPAQDLSVTSQAGVVLRLLDALRLERVHVVASDSGSAIAQLLAARHPRRVRTLLLTNGDSEARNPPAALGPVIDLSRRALFVKQRIEPWYENRNLARAPGEFGGLCYADAAHPTDEAIELYFAPLLSSPERARQVERYAVALATPVLAGVGPALGRCPAPARIVWGMADTIFDLAGADHLDRAFANSRGVRRLPEARLFWPEEQPEVLAEEAHRLWRDAAP